MPATPYRRTAGVLLPLFSMRSSTSWGIGEFADVRPFSEWMHGAGLSLLQLLPINAMSPGQNSPYSALSSAALDPIFIAPEAVASFTRAGGISALPKDARDALEAARHATRVDSDAVRAAKGAAFDLAWQAFGDADAEALDAFVEREQYWLDDYTLYRALTDEHGGDWTRWPDALRHREPDAMARARTALARPIRFHGWLQWIADAQWGSARADARENGVDVFGDLPFMVSTASADVWGRQQDFMLDATVGTPPDAFSDAGQDWGVPVYRWPEIAAGGDAWLRMRGRRAASLFDGFRVDHLVGFYRTFVRPRRGAPSFLPGEPYFLPDAPPEQIAQGERIMRLFLETGAAVTAEDLGTVPDYVRESLGRLGLPGYRILRWERHWHQEGQPFRDPAEWPANAVATTGTHDTESLAEWWEHAAVEERRLVQAIPDVARALGTEDHPTLTPRVRDALLAALYDSPSNLLILPFQDLFGWRDRVNTPATVGDANWRWTLPWPVDRLPSIPVAADRARELHALAEETGRL
ncbi:MAG: 4-alpha-glucanotransferase [Vicinamibacterales bacterium]